MVLPSTDVTIFSDGSEQHWHGVGYGYAIYQGQELVTTGKGSINSMSHVFDVKAIGV
jgi:hypothetical protein